MGIEALQLVAALGAAAAMVNSYLLRASSAGSALLLVYWSLSLPWLGTSLVQLLRQYPLHRNIAARLLEPLNAPEPAVEDGGLVAPPRTQFPRALPIDLREVSVKAGGHLLLENVSVRIAAGEHVAIVGASGAGKSTLVGLLLGWQRICQGELRVGGEPLDGARLEWLREQIAWVDPSIQLWNRSLLANLEYGASKGRALAMGKILETADLTPVLLNLPDGLQTSLGEGGAMLSGGEGQRVRFGRALASFAAPLVILDEPFRGLERTQRSDLLTRARNLWSTSTLLCVTHDLAETQTFPRVLVMRGGQVIEDGAPAELLAKPGSHYLQMLRAEQAIGLDRWSVTGWRRFFFEQGRAKENSPGGGR